MKKILSERLVCTSAQSTQLIRLGIARITCFCYEWVTEYEFAGEYVGQEAAIPAWTYEELLVMVGPQYIKPDLLSRKDWTPNANMMLFALFLPSKRKDFKNGAEALAELLIYLISAKEINVTEVNERLTHYETGEHYEPTYF